MRRLNRLAAIIISSVALTSASGCFRSAPPARQRIVTAWQETKSDIGPSEKQTLKDIEGRAQKCQGRLADLENHIYSQEKLKFCVGIYGSISTTALGTTAGAASGIPAIANGDVNTSQGIISIVSGGLALASGVATAIVVGSAEDLEDDRSKVVVYNDTCEAIATAVDRYRSHRTALEMLLNEKKDVKAELASPQDENTRVALDARLSEIRTLFTEEQAKNRPLLEDAQAFSRICEYSSNSSAETISKRLKEVAAIAASSNQDLAQNPFAGIDKIPPGEHQKPTTKGGYQESITKYNPEQYTEPEHPPEPVLVPEPMPPIPASPRYPVEDPAECQKMTTVTSFEMYNSRCDETQVQAADTKLLDAVTEELNRRFEE